MKKKEYDFGLILSKKKSLAIRLIASIVIIVVIVIVAIVISSIVI